ncbi:molybdopterin-dependent oxidoreductase [Nostocoides sp. F2B08]|uniref:molybdopterin-dependent oxidoreductase n=1 Tax=Nostocoides sp. F2B08 TaxID=2653936 RepID=UPI001263124B|nr:molybdopterin-dependent oxidoreductase [Tetrasphaera sp. F2B08]KAB7745142.1 molybdopterin-dependent oxidoreductase [Tetrasphaera sp. F2B08]
MRTYPATDAPARGTTGASGGAGGRASTARYALAGLLSAAGAMAAGHAVAGLVEPAASPVLAVGTAVIDATPTPVKTWAVDAFGTADKPILIAGVAVVTALLAATAGILSRRHPWAGAAIVIVLGVLATLAAHLTVGQSQMAILPGVIATIVGVALLSWLTSLAARADSTRTSGPSGPDTQGTREVERPTDHVAEPGGASLAGAGADRRTFVIGSIGVAAAAAGLAAVGQVWARPAQLARAIVLPPATEPLGPLPTDLATEVSGISPLRTPTADFYRIDTALTLPRVDLDSWRLRIDGDVDNPYELSFDDLLAMPLIERDITLNCVSNEVGGPYIGSTRWLGVRTSDLLAEAGVRPGADQILSRSVDGMTISTPVAALTDDREALIAIAMDGAPLPQRNGFPARLVTPGLYGYVGATKWLESLTATTYAAERAYWTERGWAELGPVKTQARIDTPAPLRPIRSGQTAIGGVAWAQGRGIERVEVRIDDGPWTEATLGDDVGIDYWRQWYLPWEATTGRHTLVVRATDGTGETQTEERADVFPDGAAGWHTVVVTVA